MPIDMSAAAKAPPRKSTARSSTSKAAATPDPSIKDKREAGLNGLAQLAQGVCLLTRQYADAAAIGRHCPPISSELATLAGQYEVIAGPVDFLIQVGPFAGLIAALVPFGMQIAANHRWIDASAMGAGGSVVPPEVLEAQMKAQLARAQAEAMREQQEAIRDAQRAQAEYEAMMAEEAGESANAA